MRCGGSARGPWRARRTRKVHCANHGTNPLSSGGRAPKVRKHPRSDPLPSRLTPRLFCCPLVRLAAAIIQDVPPSSKGGTATRTLAHGSRGRGTMQTGRACTGAHRGARLALPISPSTRYAWNVSARGDLWRRLWSITSFRTEGMKAGFGSAATGPAYVSDATQ